MTTLIILVALLLLMFSSQSYGKTTCSLTTPDMEGPFFVSGSPKGSDLAPIKEISVKQNEIFLEGKIFDKNCKEIKNGVTTVEIWYSGGDPTHYTFKPATLWYRGQSVTNFDGQYKFHGTYPGVYAQRPIRHIHYKVTTKTKEFTTQLYFPHDVPKSYEDYVVGRETQFPQSIEDIDGGARRVTFDIVLDVL